VRNKKKHGNGALRELKALALVFESKAFVVRHALKPFLKKQAAPALVRRLLSHP
jgi:hypothetical protein